jgi:hypothetical protein
MAASRDFSFGAHPKSWTTKRKKKVMEENVQSMTPTYIGIINMRLTQKAKQ